MIQKLRAHFSGIEQWKYTNWILCKVNNIVPTWSQQLVRNFSVIEKVLRVFCPFCNSRPKKCVGFLTFSKKCCIFRTFQKSSLPFIKWVALSYQYHQDRAQHNVLVSPVSSNKSYKVLFKVSNRKM